MTCILAGTSPEGGHDLAKGTQQTELLAPAWSSVSQRTHPFCHLGTGAGEGPSWSGLPSWGGPRDLASEAWPGARQRLSWAGRGALTTPSLHRMLREKLRAEGLWLRAGSGGPGPLRVRRRPHPPCAPARHSLPAASVTPGLLA